MIETNGAFTHGKVERRGRFLGQIVLFGLPWAGNKQAELGFANRIA